GNLLMLLPGKKSRHCERLKAARQSLDVAAGQKSRHCERLKAARQSLDVAAALGDCRVALLLAMTRGGARASQ
ncbi:MAG: hypothetical protein AAFS02_07730, partial [Pseudomonadota bacterium]